MAIYVTQNENGSWDVYIAGREIAETNNLPYTAAMSRARDLIHRNGGGDIIITDSKGHTSYEHVD